MSLNDILNAVKLENEEEIVVPNDTFKVTDKKIFSNIDLLDANIGQTNVKILGIGGAGNNIVSYLNKSRG
jgi:cell division GTPase FtsZ